MIQDLINSEFIGSAGGDPGRKGRQEHHREKAGERRKRMHLGSWYQDKYHICCNCFEKIKKYCKEHKEGKE